MIHQPPTGGCVLKLHDFWLWLGCWRPAAYGRLRVETLHALSAHANVAEQPPTGGCVLKHVAAIHGVFAIHQPPTGGCVLKHSQAWEAAS